MVKLLKKSDYKHMKWKNGLGETEQIAILPPEADFAAGDYLWRVSSATVRSEGPFSQFPGYDRWLVVVKGDGLIINGFPLLPLSPFHFSGEELIHSELLDIAVVDLGIIYRRDKIKASMMVEEIGSTHSLSLAEGLHFIFCVQGSFNAGDFRISEGETLQVAEPMTVEMRSMTVTPVKYVHLKLIEY